MCGRFTLTTPAEVLAEAFDLEDVTAPEPRYNIAPSQDVAVVGRRSRETPRRLALLRWGIRPSPAGPRPPLLINARAESLERRASFRDAFRERRCLVPADGFYEWQPVPGSRRKQPYLVRHGGGGLMAFAGLWMPGQGGELPPACTIVTTEPNDAMRPLHDRMPVILPPQTWTTWLDPGLHDTTLLLELLQPYAGALELTPVSDTVNDARHDAADCIAPLPRRTPELR